MIAERTAGWNQRREDQGVRADDPLQATRRQPKFPLHRRKSDADNQDIEDHHALRQAGSGQSQPLDSPNGQGRHCFCLARVRAVSTAGQGR